MTDADHAHIMIRTYGGPAITAAEPLSVPGLALVRHGEGFNITHVASGFCVLENCPRPVPDAVLHPLMAVDWTAPLSKIRNDELLAAIGVAARRAGRRYRIEVVRQRMVEAAHALLASASLLDGACDLPLEGQRAACNAAMRAHKGRTRAIATATKDLHALRNDLVRENEMAEAMRSLGVKAEAEP